MTTNNPFWEKEEIEGFYASIIGETYRRFPGLEKYEHIFSFVFHAFYEQGGLVRYTDNKEGAYVEPGMLKGRFMQDLYIGVKNRIDPTTVLWSILHEYGHTLQSRITTGIHGSPALIYARETDAWDRAEEKLASFNLTAGELESFRTFRAARLQKYKAKIK